MSHFSVPVITSRIGCVFGPIKLCEKRVADIADYQEAQRVRFTGNQPLYHSLGAVVKRGGDSEYLLARVLVDPIGSVQRTRKA